MNLINEVLRRVIVTPIIPAMTPYADSPRGRIDEIIMEISDTEAIMAASAITDEVWRLLGAPYDTPTEQLPMIIPILGNVLKFLIDLPYHPVITEEPTVTLVSKLMNLDEIPTLTFREVEARSHPIVDLISDALMDCTRDEIAELSRKYMDWILITSFARVEDAASFDENARVFRVVAPMITRKNVSALDFIVKRIIQCEDRAFIVDIIMLYGPVIKAI